MNNAETTRLSPIARFRAFLAESVDELKKVHKPTRQETIQATIVTIAIMVFVSLVLSLFDFTFRKLMEHLL